MMIWLNTLLFCLGTAFGSFINAFEYRLRHKLDFVKARSMCPKCKHVLAPKDLIPLFSFIFLKGRCRYCETRVSWQYFIIELISGLLFIVSGWFVSTKMHVLGISDMFIFLIFSTFFGLILLLFLFFALYDVKHQIVPNRVMYPSLITALLLYAVLALGTHFSLFSTLLRLFEGFSVPWNAVSALVGGCFMLLIIIITRGKGMGGGDLKLMVLMGLLLGWQKLIIAFYIAIILGSVVGIVWGLVKGKIRGLKVPFALFLSIGTIISLIWGMEIWEWYVYDVLRIRYLV